jgi:hypothetical protein
MDLIREKSKELGCSEDDLVIVYDDNETYFINIEDGGIDELRKGMKKMSVGAKGMKKTYKKPLGKRDKKLVDKLLASDIPITITDTSQGKYKNDKTLRKIRIQEGVEVIDHQAFQGCSNLTEVTLPSTLRAIGENAFSNTAIVRLYIPDMVKYIGEAAFSYCMQLGNIRLPQNLPNIRNKTFDYCVVLDNIVIPTRTEYIGEYAFRDCMSLMNIHIPPSIKYIGKGAFQGCVSLVVVNLPPYFTVSSGVFPEHTQIRSIDEDLSQLMGTMDIQEPTQGLSELFGSARIDSGVSGDKDMYIESFNYLRSKHSNACFAAPTSMEDYWDMHLIWEDFPSDSTVIEDEADPNYTLYGNRVAMHRQKYRKKRVNNRGVLYVHITLKEKIIDCIKTCGKRFVVIPLVIRNVRMHKSHSNMIIYDKDTRTAERYEPEGFIPMGSDRLVYEDIDRDISEFFTSSGLIQNVSDYFGPVDFCPDWPEWLEGKIGHQKMQKLERGKNKNVMCAAWSVWYSDMRLSNPDKPRNIIITESIANMKTSGFGKFIRKYLANILGDKV